MAGIGHNQQPFVSVDSLSPVEKKQLRSAILELNDSMTRAAAERELQKETINEVTDKLGLDKKVVRRMAKVYFKANFSEEVESDSKFQDFYTKVLQETTS